MKRIVCLMMSVLVLMAFASFSLAESATATPEATATVAADETAYVGTITAIDPDAKTVTVSGTMQNLSDVLAAVAVDADASASPAADATEAPAADATVAADAAQEMTFAITDESVLSNAADATATLTIADLTVGMPVCVTFSGDDTNGYSALTIQTLPELPVVDAAAADDSAATDAPTDTATASN